MSDRFIYPAEALNGSLRVVLSGRERLLIEQHRGIIGYTREKLTVRLENGYLSVCGKDLEISEYSGRDLCVQGFINSLEFA